MSRFLWILIITVVVGVGAFFAGQQLWPMGHGVPVPPPNFMPLYMALSAIEALAFGLAVAFAVLGWPTVRELPLGAPWLNVVFFVTLLWLVGTSWVQDNLHMNVGLDMTRLVYIEYAFPLTLLAYGLVLALRLIRFALRAKTAGH
jgi:hypothetical protein